MPATTTTPNDPAEAGYTDEPEPTEAESKMTEAIARDRPTIDAAVKNFVSMVCARTMAASSTDATHDKVMMGIIPAIAKTSISSQGKSSNSNTTTTTTSSDDGTTSAATVAAPQNDDGDAAKSGGSSTTKTSIQQQVLELARHVLRAVNSHRFPVHDTVAYSMAEKPGTSAEKKEALLETSVVARLWNALAQSEQKPSRFLGRRSLRLAWKHLDVAASLPRDDDEITTIAKAGRTGEDGTNARETITVRERQLEWLRQFEGLLFETPRPLPSDIGADDDSALLWSPDGGAAELAKRRQRRLDAAKTREGSTGS